MKLTLTSLRQEMKESFGEVNERIDRLSLRLDRHIKGSYQCFREVDERFDRVDARFAQINERFEQVDARFDSIDARFEQVNRRFDKLTQDIMDTFLPYFGRVDNMLENHDRRIGALEQRSISSS